MEKERFENYSHTAGQSVKWLLAAAGATDTAGSCRLWADSASPLPLYREDHRFDADSGWVIMEDGMRHPSLVAGGVTIDRIIREIFSANQCDTACAA